DSGVQMCDKVLSRCPDEFDIGLYKGINLYFGSDFKKAEETLVRVKDEIRAYSRMHEAKENEVVPAYAPLEREVRYWTARALVRQKRLDEAEGILLELKTPEIHQPYWIQRGVYLSLAEINYMRNKNDQAESLIRRVLDWQDVRDAHEKAKLLKKEKVAAGPFDIDFR
ncbi:MAG TPA: hypothetical protein VLR94_10245, partial [Acidobacteriota bacterium]|nr:hypothetical protein [Acidobacteriota bacterium]